MSHSSEKTWGEVSGLVSAAAQNVRDELLSAEELYQRLQEVFSYAGGTNQGLADLLFRDRWIGRETVTGVQDTGANADEVALAADLVNAMLAVHQLYEAANNVAVTAADRITDLRRMI
jgi:hypothetical protein